jgi:hypothetical protein
MEPGAPKPSIEFYTTVKPSDIHPWNGETFWYIPEGERIPVVVTRIAETDGSITIFPTPAVDL